MGVFDQFPYTNFHELNLDWILQALKELEHTIDQFVAINALKYADPIQWDITSQYEKNTIVIDPQTGTAYISVEPVPAGVALTNTDYWTVVFDLGSFVVRAAKNFTDRYEAETTTTATFNSNAGDWIVWGDTLYFANVNITAGDSYVIGGNIDHFTMEDICGHLQDLLTTDKSNLVAAINEQLTLMGDLNDLNTTDKSSLVAAINDVLVIIGAIIGDLNDLNTIDQTSIVNAINEVLADITAIVGNLSDLNTTDQSNIVNAINEVLADVGDLSNLNTTDKTNLVNAINEVLIVAAQSGDVYNTAYGLNLDPTGVTDNSAIFAGLTENVGLKAGTYLIDDTITIPVQVVFAQGAVLNITSGHTVTFNGQIVAGRYQIFTGTGDVVCTAPDCVGYPEWFKESADTYWETAIEKCIIAFGETSLGNFDYYVNGTIEIEKSNRHIHGMSQLTWTYYPDTRYGTRIITAQATDPVFRIGTTTVPLTINQSTQNVEIDHLSITGTADSDWVDDSVAFYFTQALRCKLHDCSVKNRAKALHLQAVTNIHVEKNTFFNEILQDSDYNRTMIGVWIDNSVLSANNLPNVSVYLIDNIINTGGVTILDNSYGIVVSASVHAASDLFIYNNAIEWVGAGIYMVGTGAANSCNSIHIIGNELDALKANAILLMTIGLGASITIDDNYIAPASSASGTFTAIRVDNGSNISITNNTIVCYPYAQCYGVWISSCVNVSSVNNNMQDCLIGDYVTGSVNLELKDNLSNNIRSGRGIVSTTTSHSIMELALQGTFSTGIDLTTSAYNTINPTRMPTSQVTTKILEDGVAITSLGVTTANNNVIGVIAN